VIKKGKKYLSIRNDLIRLEHDPSSIAEYWGLEYLSRLLKADYGLD
jgi:hypothetical protein